MARFDGPEEEYGISDELFDQLKTQFQGNNDIAIVAYNELHDPVTVGQGSDFAKIIGHDYNADIVVWGWYRPTENVNIKIYIENIHPTELPVLKTVSKLSPVSTLKELNELTLHYRLNSEIEGLVYFICGFTQLGAKDYQGALDLFELAMNQPVWANDLINRSRVLFLTAQIAEILNQTEKAVEYSTKSIEADPEFMVAYQFRGYYYNLLEKPELAIIDFDKVIEANPNDDTTLNNRGNAYADLKEYDKAIGDYSKAIEINPLETHRFYNRALAYYEVRDFQEAIDDFSTLLNNHMTEMPIIYQRGSYYYRGTSYLYQKSYDLAINDYSKALAIDNEFSSAYNGRCEAQYFKGLYKNAIDDCKAGINYSSGINNNDRPLFFLGLAYRNLGDNKASNDYWLYRF